MNTRQLAALALAVLGTGCDSAALAPRPAADVYEFRLDTQPPLVLRWPSGSTVRVFVAGGSTPGEAAGLAAAFAQGAAAWNRYALFGEYRLAATGDLGNADVVLRWAAQEAPVDMSGCLPTGNRAVTTFCSEGGDPSNGLAVFQRSDGGPSRVKMVVTILPSQLPLGTVPKLVTHELGHVLGIGRHSPEPRDLMYGGELAVSLPSRRDQATVQVLYQMQPEVSP